MKNSLYFLIFFYIIMCGQIVNLPDDFNTAKKVNASNNYNTFYLNF